MAEKFNGNFTQQEPLSEEAIESALKVMRSGRLHRYNTAPDDPGEVALLEQEFAAKMGAKYCLAVASGGYALTTALKAVLMADGVSSGATVLTNAFTLAPVPGAISSVGAVPAFVEVSDDLVIDLDHLEQMIADTGAHHLMLSHMRGHICDMDRLMAICRTGNVTVIEDCAHTMGASWDGVLSGRYGRVGCYSTQTYKHVNSGEGGLIVSDDPEVMARAIVLSGSYMLYGRHLAAPAKDVFADIRLETPNCSGRMDNLRAALLRPQIAALDDQIARWNARYDVVAAGLNETPGLQEIKRPAKEAFVGSSIQFLLPQATPDDIRAVMARCAVRGVELKWFGEADPVAFTSRYSSWKYAPAQVLPQTDRVLDGLMDMRLPLTFSLADCALIALIIRQEVMRMAKGAS